MINKLSLRLTSCILIILVSLAAIFIPVFIYFQKSMFVSFEKERMLTFADGMQSVLIKEDADLIQDYIEENDSEEYKIKIRYRDGSFLYTNEKKSKNKTSSDLAADLEEDEDNHFKLKLYTENSTPVVSPENKERGVHKVIVLRKLYEVNGQTYYVYVRESLRTMDALFSYTNRMLLYILVLFIIVCLCALFVLTKSFTKPIEDLSEVTRKVADEDYSARYSGRIRKDEIGTLSKNVNHMVDAIQENITELDNYNFLLNERIKKLSEIEEFRKKMIAQLTHELKTPLTIISIQVEMMNDLEEGEKKQKYYKNTVEEIQKMSNTITNVLRNSANEKDIFQGEFKEINLSSLIDELCEKDRNYVNSHGITLIKELEPSCIKYVCSDHVEHVFHNYLANAIKHVKEKGQIKVGLKKKGDKVRLSVYNDGPQIPDKNKDKIWMEFVSFNKNISKNSSGLGLYIVQEISILYETECGYNNYDQGVEFWFDFVDFSTEE